MWGRHLTMPWDVATPMGKQAPQKHTQGTQSVRMKKGGAKNTVTPPAWFLMRIPKFHLLKINWLQNHNRNLDANQYGNSPPNFLTIPLNFFLSTLIMVFHFKGEKHQKYTWEKIFSYTSINSLMIRLKTIIVPFCCYYSLERGLTT